jgi:hypothetical protein
MAEVTDGRTEVGQGCDGSTLTEWHTDLGAIREGAGHGLRSRLLLREGSSLPLKGVVAAVDVLDPDYWTYVSAEAHVGVAAGKSRRFDILAPMLRVWHVGDAGCTELCLQRRDRIQVPLDDPLKVKRACLVYFKLTLELLYVLSRRIHVVAEVCK